MKTKFLMLTILFLIVSNAYSQTQVIRGKLIDTDSKSPLIGATIRVLGSDPVLGNVTDINGEFRIDRVPLGRVNLMVTYIGYEDRVIPNVLVTAAKKSLSVFQCSSQWKCRQK